MALSRGDALEESVDILKPRGTMVSLVGPLDAAFARARGLNFVLTFVFRLMSRKNKRLEKKRELTYSFLFARPDGNQLAETGQLLKSERIRPVIGQGIPVRASKGSA